MLILAKERKVQGYDLLTSDLLPTQMSQGNYWNESVVRVLM